MPGRISPLEPETSTRSRELAAQADRLRASVDAMPADDPGRPAAEAQLARLEDQRDQARLVARGEAPDPTLARDPADQPKLDKINRQLQPLEDRVGSLADKGTARTARENEDFTRAQDQLAQLRRTRDQLVGQEDTEGLATRFWRPQGKPKPYVAPVEPGAEKGYEHYQFQNGTSVYAKAFADAGYDPRLATSFPVKKQVDILLKQTKDQFGFKGVQLSNDHPGGKTAIDELLNVYRATHDMMASLKLPLGDASLNGKLSLHLEPMRPRGHPQGGGYYGLYRGSDRSIHLAGGANSFGHEWVHALDHELTGALGADKQHGWLLSTFTRNKGLDPKDSVNARFAKLINTMFYDEGDLAHQRMQLQQTAAQVGRNGKPTAAAERAQRQLEQLEAGAKGPKVKSSEYREMAKKFAPNDPYWSSEYEMLARAGESYVARKMEDNGVSPRGVVMPDEAYARGLDARLKMTFPKDSERLAIHQAFEDLMDGLRAKSIFGSPEAALSRDYGMSDPAGFARTAELAGGAPRLRDQAVQFLRIGNNLRRIQQGFREVAPFDRSRPVASRPWYKRLALTMGHVVNSKLADMDAIIAANNPAVRRLLQPIRDRFGTVHGSGKGGMEGYEQRAIAIAKTAQNRLANILDNNGLLKGLNDPKNPNNAMIRWGMVTGQRNYRGQAMPGNVLNAIQQIRHLNNQMYDLAKSTGLDVEYVGQHYPRFYDTVKITNDRPGFLNAASRLYKFMFDKDVGQPGDNPAELLKRYRNLGKGEKDTIDQGTPGVRGDMRKLGDNLRRQKEIIDQGLHQTPQGQAELTRLQDQARILAETHHDTIGDYIAGRGADDWFTRIHTGYDGDFEKIGPSGRFLNHRTLPPEADQIMEKYMQGDVASALPQYYNQVGRKVSYAERFGNENQLINEQLRKASPLGLGDDDAFRLRSIIQQITGRGENGNETHRKIGDVANAINAYGATLLMPRSMWTSLHEFAVSGLATGDMRTSLRSLGALIGGIMHTGDAAERRHLADFVGVTNSKLAESLWSSRVGSDYADSPRIAHLMQKFYQTIGLTGITNATRRANFAGLDWYLRNSAKNFLDPGTGSMTGLRRDRAQRLFNELAIPQNRQQRFTQYLAQHDGMPDYAEISDPNNEFAPLYARAMRTLSDWASQDPKKGDRPALAETPLGSLVWQLQHYNYGFQRNVLDPMMHNMGKDYQFMRDQAAAKGAGWLSQQMHGIGGLAYSGAGFAGAGGLLVAASLVSTMVREALFNKDKLDEKMQDGTAGEWLRDLAIQRSGLSGTIDPLVQVVNNLRYNSDINSLVAGASPTFIGKQLTDILRGLASAFDPEAPETNTRAHDAVKAFYNLFGVPTMAMMSMGLSGAGVPLVSPGASFLFQKLSSQQAAEKAADIVTGPKGAKLPTAPEGDEFAPDQFGQEEMDQGFTPDQFGQEEEAGAADKKGSTVGGGIPWGMLDDFISPAYQSVIKPTLGVLPGPVKAIGAGVAGVGALATFLNRMAPYRNAPAPQQELTR